MGQGRGYPWRPTCEACPPETQEGRVTIAENSFHEADGPEAVLHEAVLHEGGAILVISGDLSGCPPQGFSWRLVGKGQRMRLYIL